MPERRRGVGFGWGDRLGAVRIATVVVIIAVVAIFTRFCRSVLILDGGLLKARAPDFKQVLQRLQGVGEPCRIFPFRAWREGGGKRRAFLAQLMLQIDVEKLQERPDLNAEHEAMRRRFTLIAQRVVETASKRNGGRRARVVACYEEKPRRTLPSHLWKIVEGV